MFILELIYAGLQALKEYIALHVITCLIPAFLLAGAMVTFVSKETIIFFPSLMLQSLFTKFLMLSKAFFFFISSLAMISPLFSFAFLAVLKI